VRRRGKIPIWANWVWVTQSYAEEGEIAGVSADSHALLSAMMTYF
jgi:hypothetical protein